MRRAVFLDRDGVINRAVVRAGRPFPPASVRDYDRHSSTRHCLRLLSDVVEREMPDKAPIRVETTTSDDLRSYHVSSAKIAQKLGYVPRRTIEDAIRDLCRAFKAGKLLNSFTDERYDNVKTVKHVAPVLLTGAAA